MTKDIYDAIIIGGGIVGLASTVGLYHRGIKKILVIEKANDLEAVGSAIGLFPNGFRAIDAISPEVKRKVSASCIQSERYMVKALDGSVITDRDVKNTEKVGPTYLVWYLLQQYLAEDLPEGMLRLGNVLESYHVDEGVVHVRIRNQNDDSVGEERCRVLIGADGIQSTVRDQMFGKRELTYPGKMMFRAVLDKDLLDEGICPPVGTSLGYMSGEEGKLFGFRETAKGIVTVTSMAKFETPVVSENNEAKKVRLKEMFADYPPDVQHVLDRVPSKAIYENAVYALEKVEEQWSVGPIVILGDAAHAMTPGLGQGANQGLEDACELAYALAPLLTEGVYESIPMELETFCKKRYDRVKEVHRESSEQTGEVNRSSGSNRKQLYASLSKDPTFTERLYGWKPSFETNSSVSKH